MTIEKSLVPLSRKDLMELWPYIAVDTIKKILIDLQNEGTIQKIGNFKNAKYKNMNKIQCINMNKMHCNFQKNLSHN